MGFKRNNTNGKPKKEWFESNVLSWPEKKDKIKNKKEWNEKYGYDFNRKRE